MWFSFVTRNHPDLSDVCIYIIGCDVGFIRFSIFIIHEV